jgi:3-phosphoshikimate 1-carboxyvinyltransferase
MNKIAIAKPTKLINCEINLPASKSESNRVLILKYLSASDFRISNISDSDDTRVLKTLLDVYKKQKTLNTGNCGTAMRFLTAFLAIQQGEWTLTGDHRMRQRPISGLVNSLVSLGAEITYSDKKDAPPLKIKGKAITGGSVSVDGSISSQFISALILIAPFLPEGIMITLSGEVASRPYIEMTLSILKHFGIKYSYKKNFIGISKQEITPKDYIVESDWTAASYWYQIVAFSKAAEIKLIGLKRKSRQGDAIIARLFEELGVSTEFITDGVIIRKNGQLTDHFEFNFSDNPDLAQTFGVTCAGLNIDAKLTGLNNLRYKETERLSALSNELKKAGYNVETEHDALLIRKSERMSNRQLEIKTYNDHRMAMAFAPLAIKLGGIMLDEPSVVIKSYPQYFNDLEKAGFKVNMMSCF